MKKLNYQDYLDSGTKTEKGTIPNIRQALKDIINQVNELVNAYNHLTERDTK